MYIYNVKNIIIAAIVAVIVLGISVFIHMTPSENAKALLRCKITGDSLRFCAVYVKSSHAEIREYKELLQEREREMSAIRTKKQQAKKAFSE